MKQITGISKKSVVKKRRKQRFIDRLRRTLGLQKKELNKYIIVILLLLVFAIICLSLFLVSSIKTSPTTLGYNIKPVESTETFDTSQGNSFTKLGYNIKPVESTETFDTSQGNSFTKEKEFFTDYIVRKYRVEKEVSEEIVNAVFSSCLKYNINPLLVFAIIEIESSFDRTAVSEKGAFGLMQVHYTTWSHIVSKEELFLIDRNIDVGVKILSEYIVSSRYDVNRALCRYVGSENTNYLTKVKYLVGSYYIDMEM